MPATVRLKVLSARNLPVMDKHSFSTDAFVEIRIGNTTFKTDVVKQCLSPVWTGDWYSFELDDIELQEEIIQIKVLDHDTYSAHDIIGRTNLVISSFLGRESNRTINAWFPIYDTLHGLRGEINLLLSIEVFSDTNRTRLTSLGVEIFYSSCIPQGYRLESLLGLVSEVAVSGNASEPIWIEKLRTTRASNDARYRIFSKLRGEILRKLSIKVLNMGGDSIIGLRMHLNLDGDTGVVLRGLGTAALLIQDPTHLPRPVPATQHPPPSRSPRPTTCSPQWASTSVDNAAIQFSTPQSPEPNWEETTPSLKSPQRLFKFPQQVISTIPTKRGVDIILSQFPFMTLASLPDDYIQNLGGIVSAKSVKLVDGGSYLNDSELRSWWSELRLEVRSHMRTLGCTAVIGYQEECVRYEGLVVLSASGTAVTVNPPNKTTSPAPPKTDTIATARQPMKSPRLAPRVRSRYNSGSSNGSSGSFRFKAQNQLSVDTVLANSLSVATKAVSPNSPVSPQTNSNPLPCFFCHVPLQPGINLKYPGRLAKCALCQESLAVPHLVFATCDPPSDLPSRGHHAFIQVVVSRSRKDSKGESGAREMSEALPFVEYDIHRIMMQKLKIHGMNAAFRFKIRLSLSDDVIIATATCTGLHLTALPNPNFLKISDDAETFASIDLCDTQNQLNTLSQEIRNHYEIPTNKTMIDPKTGFLFDRESLNSVSQAEEDQENMDSDKPIDDDVHLDDIPVLLGCKVPVSDAVCQSSCAVYSAGTSHDPRSISSSKLHSFLSLTQLPLNNLDLSNHSLSSRVQDSLQGVTYRLRNLGPCLHLALQSRLDVVDDEVLQILSCGTYIQCQSQLQQSSLEEEEDNNENEDGDFIFEIESKTSDELEDAPPLPLQPSADLSVGNSNMDPPPPVQNSEIMPPRCVLTPLSMLPGTVVEAYLGFINMFIVRETSSLREYGGISGFVQSCLTESQVLLRGHTEAVGGNLLLSFQMSCSPLVERSGRNQAVCILGLAGDRARVLWEDPRHQRSSTASPSPTPLFRARTLRPEHNGSLNS